VGGQEIGMFHAAWAAALLLMATGCVTRGRARAAVNLQVLIVIGCALGIGRAMETTGAAKALAAWLVGPFEALGPVGVLAGVYLFATVMCEVVSSKAAVAIVAPIAFAAAQNAGADPRPFAFATAIASCAAFMFPVADQTNLIVYGPGGYRTLDFVRVGLPLKIIVGIVAVTLIPIIWPL
jgi:di/tricarboxylate transporter